MDYSCSEVRDPPIEILLNQVEKHDKGNVVDVPPPPTIEQFLEEEGTFALSSCRLVGHRVAYRCTYSLLTRRFSRASFPLSPIDTLRECRGNNKRLIAYLCRPEIVRALVKHSVTVPSKKTDESVNTSTGKDLSDGNDNSDGVSSLSDAEAEEFFMPISAGEADSPNVRKYPYVASELLSADIRELCDVVVGDDQVMDLIFSCLEDSPDGQLDPFVATHFSKVLVSLLKTRNAETIQQIKRRGRMLTNGLIKHIALAPISELIVRLLDSPEHERSYDAVVRPPTADALSLLTDADLMNGLAESFVVASNRMSESETAAQRRHREETLANVTATITGLTERILQLPALGVTIPNQLSTYHSPKAVVRLLDAGLFTSATPPSLESEEIDSSSMAVSGNHSALLHALGLAAKLMTTKANEWETDKNSIIDCQRGEEPTKVANPNTEESTEDEIEVTQTPHAFTEADVNSAGSLLRTKVPGETIISTTYLENELVIRFQRLAQMFGSMEEDVNKKLPLGSLRLKLAEFFTACMKKASRTTVEHIMELGVPSKLLELFRCYEWSSMLHGVITCSIISALESGSSGAPARMAWFNASLVSWLLTAWTNNDQKEADENSHFRAGYMGHLIKIGAALRTFINETESTNKEELESLMDAKSISKFNTFSEKCLTPAHQIEITPLCAGDSETEEIFEDEATELMDMGVGEVIEGLTQGDPNMAIKRFSEFLLHKSGGNIDFDEDEEIQTVDTDLSHFADGDDDDEEVEEVRGIDVDHDLPQEMRQQLYEANASSSSRRARPFSLSKEAESNGVTEGSKSRGQVDDDDDGTYVSFISKPSADSGSLKEAEEDRLAVRLKEDMQLVEQLSIAEADANAIVPIPSPSLEVDAAVTEIDEPQPVTPSVLATVSPLNRDVASPGTDTDESSDDDLGEWVTFNPDEISARADEPPSLAEKAKLVKETAEAEASAVVAPAAEAAATGAVTASGTVPLGES